VKQEGPKKEMGGGGGQNRKSSKEMKDTKEKIEGDMG
jgi:hypothetical protein